MFLCRYDRRESLDVVLFAAPGILIVGLGDSVFRSGAEIGHFFRHVASHAVCDVDRRSVAQREICEIRIAEEIRNVVAGSDFVGEIVLCSDSLQLLAQSVASLLDVGGVCCKVGVVGIGKRVGNHLFVGDAFVAVEAVQFIVPVVGVAT